MVVCTVPEVWTTIGVVVVPGTQVLQGVSVVAPLVVPNEGAGGANAVPDQTGPPGTVYGWVGIS